MSASRGRGLLLMQQGRLDQAAEEFRRALGEDPQDASAHGFLALCLCDLERFDDAEAAAEEAVRHGPDSDLGHYALGTIHLNRNRFDDAQRAAAEAIRIDPEDAHNRALLARVLFAQRRWADARAAAEQGLALDPTDVQCLNLRAMALQQLGLRDDARQVIEAALAHDPENEATHTNAGWAALHDGDTRAALDHFREALRIDPTMDHAREGIVEALKARNLLYALMLKYFFWMGRLSKSSQWGVVIGGYVGYRVLRMLASKNPGLAPWIWPLLGLYILFVFLSWTAVPLFNLMLRLHPYGRLALSREQILGSNLLGLVLLAAAGSGAWWLATGDPVATITAIGCLFLCLPVSATFACDAGWPRRVAAIYTLVLAASGLSALGLWLAAADPARPGSAVTTLGFVFFIGAIGCSWILNILIGLTPKR